MASFSRAAYGSNPHAGANRNNASARGWGPGWPNCQSSKMATAAGGGVRVTVRREVVDLVATLLDATAAMGYKPRPGQCWGFACRAIRGASSPSNHSWGLAVDVNSLTNPMQATFKSDIPPAVVRMWEDCGWYWGGRYGSRPDAMHFEYLGKPADVARHLAKAKAFLATAKGEKPSPTPDPVPNPAPKFTEPTVDAKKVLAEAKATGKYTGPVGAALVILGLTPDVAGYKALQTLLGYTGDNADGYAGPSSLAWLTKRFDLTLKGI